ncbi:MAG TPA: SagB family peptide dehydrogenase [Terriglobales bacterium]|nr:SagB family peptide dehydrogenase [Terriglobales bacterium]
MPNYDTDAAWKYHNGTKHSYLSVRAHGHALDWQNQPLLFKIYPTLEIMRLPKDFQQTGVAALSAIVTTGAAKHEGLPNLEQLAQILFFAAGVTKSRKYPGGETFFRAAACTGALYEIELYVVCGDLPGLDAGVYHFSVAEFGLRQLRAGDFRTALVKATGEHPAIVHAPVIMISTGTYWRNAWKYRSRTYRHFGWDNGTILANLLAMSEALHLPAEIVTGFADSEVNRLVDLDTQREVSLSLTPVGYTAAAANTEAREITKLGLPIVAYSKEEVEYPAMRQMHEASTLTNAAEVIDWRKRVSADPQKTAAPATDSIPLRSLPDSGMLPDTVEQVIMRRGSTRKFALEPIPYEQLSTILDRATRGLPADFLPRRGAQLNDLYLVANRVEGLAAGAYFYDRTHHCLQLLKDGSFDNKVRYLGLEQTLPGDASVAIFFLADLHRALKVLGNRGYRAAQLEAGMIGGRIYLAAYALHLGATGLTFYDDEVVHFFSPHAKGKSAIFLVAVGKSHKPTTTASILAT